MQTSNTIRHRSIKSLLIFHTFLVCFLRTFSPALAQPLNRKGLKRECSLSARSAAKASTNWPISM